jgi:D-glycero-D-manno-heptose 1,7-bisphosphate phosphatase
MHRALGQVGGRIDAVFFCPHGEEAKCHCRKPASGLLEEISHRFNVNLKGVPSIGDAQRDLDAAAAVGALPILVLTGKGEKTRQAGTLPPGTLVFANLAEAVQSIVR